MLHFRWVGMSSEHFNAVMSRMWGPPQPLGPASGVAPAKYLIRPLAVDDRVKLVNAAVGAERASTIRMIYVFSAIDTLTAASLPRQTHLVLSWCGIEGALTMLVIHRSLMCCRRF